MVGTVCPPFNPHPGAPAPATDLRDEFGGSHRAPGRLQRQMFPSSPWLIVGVQIRDSESGPIAGPGTLSHQQDSVII